MKLGTRSEFLSMYASYRQDKTMKTLNFYNAEPADELVWPDQARQVALDSPALTIFTDFKEQTPLIIDVTTTAVEAEHLMKQEHVRMKMVVDKDGKFVGIVDSNDLNERELLKRIAKGNSRNDIMAADFMRRKKTLKALDYEEVEKSTVEDVIETLKRSGQQHCLVIDRKSHQIRGVISASDLARHLSLPIDINTDSSFLAIFKAIS